MSKPALPVLTAPVLSDAVVPAVELSRQRAGIRVLVVGYEPTGFTMPPGASREPAVVLGDAQHKHDHL